MLAFQNPELGLMDGPMDADRFISMLYWLIHRRDSNFSVEEWRAWLSTATDRQKYLKRWAACEW